MIQRTRIIILLALASPGFVYRDAAATITVAAEPDRSTVHVAERLGIWVTSTRTDSAEPAPTHAVLMLGPEWQAGAQTAESERADSAGYVKTWRFELTAISETTSAITPVIILAALPGGPHQLATNRVLGPMIAIEILPVRAPSRWPRLVTVIVVVATLVASAFTLARAMNRRRRQRRQPALTPLEAALAMLSEVGANRREDRAARFFADVERVLSGYLGRRMGRSLGSVTANEIALLAGGHSCDPEAVRDLEAILQRCTIARFSVAKADYTEMARLEDLTRSTLERLDAAWVPVDSPAETSPGAGT